MSLITSCANRQYLYYIRLLTQAELDLESVYNSKN